MMAENSERGPSMKPPELLYLFQQFGRSALGLLVLEIGWTLRRSRPIRNCARRLGHNRSGSPPDDVPEGLSGSKTVCWHCLTLPPPLTEWAAYQKKRESREWVAW
jgi:hypothetical protein